MTDRPGDRPTKRHMDISYTSIHWVILVIIIVIFILIISNDIPVMIIIIHTTVCSIYVYYQVSGQVFRDICTSTLLCILSEWVTAFGCVGLDLLWRYRENQWRFKVYLANKHYSVYKVILIVTLRLILIYQMALLQLFFLSKHQDSFSSSFLWPLFVIKVKFFDWQIIEINILPQLTKW